jgi:hypothetical protein
VPSKVFTIKAAAAALVAVLSIGGVAAATPGLLPDQASPVADQATATTGADAAAHGLGKATVANLAGSAQTGSTSGQGRESAVGPDATGAARAGLCRAWQGGQGANHGRKAESMASRPWSRPPAAPTTSPPTARTWPPTPTAEPGVATVQRPPHRPRPARQHRPWRAWTGRTPDHHRLTPPDCRQRTTLWVIQRSQ